MKINEIIVEGLRTDNPCWKGYHPVGTKKKNGKTVPNCVPTESLEEGPSSVITIKDAKKALAAMGFEPTGRRRGSHDVWKDKNGILFTVPLHGKELDYGVTKNLFRMMRDRGFKMESFIGNSHESI